MAKSLLALRADTPGAERVIHFNNAGCGLLTTATLQAIQDHVELEATIGGYEAAAARADAVAGFYEATARLLNCRPENVAFASSATHAYSVALSAIPFAAGDVIVTTRNDFVSNQLAFLSLRKRFGVEVIHAPDLPDFLTATPRKFLRGPRGSGFLFVSDRVLEAGHEPLFIDMYGARWTAAAEYQPLDTAARFEDWEFSYSTVLGCAAAIRYANEVGVEAGGRRACELAATLRSGLSPLPGVRVLDRGRELGALVTFAIEGRRAEPFKAELDRWGINSALSFRQFAQYDFGDKDIEWCMRLSPHYYNTEEEVTQVLAAIEELAR